MADSLPCHGLPSAIEVSFIAASAGGVLAISTLSMRHGDLFPVESTSAVAMYHKPALVTRLRTNEVSAYRKTAARALSGTAPY